MRLEILINFIWWPWCLWWGIAYPFDAFMEWTDVSPKMDYSATYTVSNDVTPPRSM